MRKIIAIGESVFHTVFRGSEPVKSYVGGRIANAASSLALAGLPVIMVSECADDHVGNLIIDYLKSNKVDVTSVDRYSNGSTPFSVIFEEDGQAKERVNYGVYPADRFDVMWPRIDEDDIVIFGSLYAVENDNRKRLFEILQYAYDRKALIVYLPGFEYGINYSITKVMPNILENFEFSDVVVATDGDLHHIFPNEDGEKAYRHHMMYCHRYMHISPDCSTTIYGRGEKSSVKPAAEGGNCNHLGWQAGYVAGFVYGLVKCGVTHKGAGSVSQSTWQSIVQSAYEFADNCVQNGKNHISAEFAQQKG